VRLLRLLVKLMSPERSQWIARNCWTEVTKKMPIPCVDTIVWKKNAFLMGWRTIPPYKHVWALLGGRMTRGESFAQTAIRHCRKSGIEIHKPCFVGVYPIKFPSRHDITVCLSAKWKSGSPVSTIELSRYRLFEINRLHEIRPIGTNYQRMLRDWKRERRVASPL